MTYLDKDSIKLKYLLGTYLKSGEYSSYEDAMYDLMVYMEEKGSKTISSSSVHYALKVKVDSDYVEDLMKWAVMNSYFDAKESAKKIVYTPLKSPFK